MFFEGVLGEVVRWVLVAGGIYLITGVLSLLSVTYSVHDPLYAITHKEEVEGTPYYQKIPKLQIFLAYYCQLAMIAMVVVVGGFVFVTECIPKGLCALR